MALAALGGVSAARVQPCVRGQELKECCIPCAGKRRSRVKNFPHQHNQLKKLRASLEAIRGLLQDGGDPSDDGELGNRLAELRIHKFRDITYGEDNEELDDQIAKRLAREESKPKGSQSARTAARENRKTLRHLGWLEDSTSQPTQAGLALLETSLGSDAELKLVQPGVAQISVTDELGETSHPIRVLLRLAHEVGFASRAGMELALEVVDDSEAEFERVRDIAQMGSTARQEHFIELGVTRHRIDNARKVLPKFAEDAGFLTRTADGRFLLTDAGHDAIAQLSSASPSKPASTSPAPPVRKPRDIPSTTDANNIAPKRGGLPSSPRTLTEDEQWARAQLLYERTDRHQELVRLTVRACRPGKYSEDTASYDLLVEPDEQDEVYLVEAKSIKDDEVSQIRNAVAQLLYYEYFYVAPNHPGKAIRKTVVVDNPIADELVGFLQTLGIGAILVNKAETRPLNQDGSAISQELFEPGSASDRER